MRSLRICLIASSRFPVREPFMGGLEAYTHALATALVERGHRVSLFAAAGSDPRLRVTEWPAVTFSSSTEARADVGSMPEAWMQEHHAYLDLMLSLSQMQHGEFDVVHNNSLHHLPIAMSRTLPFPVLTTLHTPPVAWLESAMVFAAPDARFIAVSRRTAAAWRHAVDATTIYNGVDTRFWRRGRGGGRAIWSGRIVAEKAPHDAVDAARLADIPLDLVGPIHDSAYFDSEIRPRLADGRVRYLGHLDRDSLREAVAAASVAVVTPRWDEPFGLVAVEALACGTPVAAYDSGALCEIVSSSTGRLAPAGDLPALAEAMRQAQGLDRATVRAVACSSFDHGRMVDAYETAYREMSDHERAA